MSSNNNSKIVRYFLFGDRACHILSKNGINSLLSDIIEKYSVIDGNFKLHVWNENDCPLKILEAYQGYYSYKEISLKDYNKLK